MVMSAMTFGMVPLLSASPWTMRRRVRCRLIGANRGAEKRRGRERLLARPGGRPRQMHASTDRPTLAPRRIGVTPLTGVLRGEAADCLMTCSRRRDVVLHAKLRVRPQRLVRDLLARSQWPS